MKLFFVWLSVLFVFFSCSRRSAEDDIIPPPTPPLSRQVIGYGVISSSYTHVLDKRGEEGAALGLLRKGSIVEVLERRPVVTGSKAESWVYVSGSFSGWLRESELRVYDSAVQAKTAAGALIQ